MLIGCLKGVVSTPSPGGSPRSAATSGRWSAFRPPPLTFEPPRGCPQGESGLRGTSDPTVGGWERGGGCVFELFQASPRPPTPTVRLLVSRSPDSPQGQPRGGSNVNGGGRNALHLPDVAADRGLPPGEGVETTLYSNPVQILVKS